MADAGLLKARAIVQEVGVVEGRSWVRLDRTIFHAQGGGQKADRGMIGGVTVSHVVHSGDGDVTHYVEENKSFAVGTEVDIELDGDWRRLNARYHSGGHLIAALIEARFPSLRAVSGHHWPGQARVEFDGEPKPEVGMVAAVLTDDLARAIESNPPVRVVGEPYTDRSVQMGAHPSVPCGGTHVAHLADLHEIRISKVRKKSGRIRVSYTFATE